MALPQKIMLAKNSLSKNIRPLMAAVIVATGLAIVWAIAFGWCGSVIGNLFSTGSVSERLQIAADGTPVIVSLTDSGQLDVGRRTIDGDVWPNDYEHWIGGAYFTSPSRERGLLEYPLSWNKRFSGGTDGKKPPTAWYLLRNAGPHGRAYFMGFDAFSKLPIGYIGTKGFRMTPLPEEELFDFPEAQSFSKRGLFNGEMVSTQGFFSYEIVNSWRHDLMSGQRLPPWLVYITEADRLLEVDLRKRSVRIALELPGIGKVSKLSEVVSKAEESDAQPEAGIDSEARRTLTASSPIRLVSTGSLNLFSTTTGTLSFFTPSEPGEIKTEKRLAILTNDQIVIYDPLTDEKREFKLPADRKFLEGQFYAYLIEPEKLLVEYKDGHWEKGFVQQLFWLAPDGKVERQERLELTGYTPPSQRSREWATAGLMPLPVVLLGKTLAYDPWMRLQGHREDNYAAALRSSVEVNWPPMVVVALIALVMAGIAMRWHLKYRRPQAGAWWLMVFLFGPMGLLAYWLQQKRSVLEPCASCDKVVPRDRGECADCGAEFPVPERRGTEIFA